MLSVLKKRRKCCSGKDLQKRKVLNLLSRSSVNTLTLLITSAKITSKKLNRLQLLSEAYSLQVKLSYILFLKQQHLQEREIKFGFGFSNECVCCLVRQKSKQPYIWKAYDAESLSQVNSALHPSGVAKSSTSFGWGKGGNVTSAGWQVTLCDPLWHVRSRSSVATLRTAIHLLLTYLLT